MGKIKDCVFMVKFVVIGQGHIGKRHAEMIRRNEESELVAVCDVLPKSELGLDDVEVPYFQSIDELLDAGLVVQNKNGGLYDKFRNRLMFPVIDARGDVVGFGGRVLDDSEPKYINTEGTLAFSKSRNLFALNFAKNTGRELNLCEGYMDVIAMHQAGFTNAVAGLGTAFTKEQISLLVRYCDELTLCFDSDEAGKQATNRALRLLSSSPMKLKIMHLADGKAPDEIIKTQGKERMKNIILIIAQNSRKVIKIC